MKSCCSHPYEAGQAAQAHVRMALAICNPGSSSIDWLAGGLEIHDSNIDNVAIGKDFALITIIGGETAIMAFNTLQMTLD